MQEEKNDLACKCEKLSDELRELERKFSAKNAELHKHYDRELERQRKAFILSEKVQASSVALHLLNATAQQRKRVYVDELHTTVFRRLDEKHGSVIGLRKLRKLL